MTASSSYYYHNDYINDGEPPGVLWAPGLVPPPSFYYRMNGFQHLHTTTPRWWRWTGDLRCICALSSWVLLFYYKIAKEEQGLRCKYISSPKYVFFFLLSFFLLLINNLCIDYFYGNHDNERPLAPSLRWKWRIGQGRGQQRLETQHVSIEPSVCFFFLQNFTSFFNTKCLFSRDLPRWQRNECRCQTSTIVTTQTMGKRLGRATEGTTGARDMTHLEPLGMFLSFFTYFLSSKYLFASRTTAS